MSSSPLAISRTPSPPSSASAQKEEDMATAALMTHPIDNGSLANAQNRQGEMPRPYKCPLCDKAFHRLEHQTRHIRTHTGEKPHACTYPGCTKRFSRSDELTRHTRIHSNPNSRRNHGKTGVQPLTAMESSSSSHSRSSPPLDPHMMPPPNYHSSSTSSSRNHSPRHSPESLSYHSSPDQGVLDQDHQMDILASAASSQLERERSTSLFPPMQADPYGSSRHQYSLYPPASHHHAHHHHHSHHTYPHSTRPLSSFPYSYSSRSNPMSRTTSHDHIEDDFTNHRARKSRPTSPSSTAPPSPTYSSSPISTPSITPAHSPRLFPRDFGTEPYTYEHGKLPSIRGLSLGARFDYDTTPASTPPMLGHGMLPPSHAQVDNAANMSTLTKMLETKKSERPSPMSLDSLLLPTSPPPSGHGSINGHEEQ
jgi:zinc finger protein CreA/MIG